MTKHDEQLCAGNLYEELQEIGKMSSENEYVELPGTSTITCASFLTIYCC